MIRSSWPSLNSSRQMAQTGAELQLLAESHRDACRHRAWYLRVASCPMACMVCCCKESWVLFSWHFVRTTKIKMMTTTVLTTVRRIHTS